MEAPPTDAFGCDSSRRNLMPKKNRDRKGRYRELRRQGQAAVVVGARAARNFALSVEKGLDHLTVMLLRARVVHGLVGGVAKS